MRQLSPLLVITACIFSLACSSASKSAPLSTPVAIITANASVAAVTFTSTSLRISTPDGTTKTITVELALTPEQNERGLGYRDPLADDTGMLFDLQTTRVPTFWMKGMRFALDMVWIGDDNRVASVTRDIPAQPGASDADLKRYSPGVPVRYVLEVNAGASARLGLGPGTPLDFALP